MLPWKGFQLPPEAVAKKAAKGGMAELRSWMSERMPRERERERERERPQLVDRDRERIVDRSSDRADPRRERPVHRTGSLDLPSRAEPVLPSSPAREDRDRHDRRASLATEQPRAHEEQRERKPVGASASIAAAIARSRPGSPQKPSPLQIETNFGYGGEAPLAGGRLLSPARARGSPVREEPRMAVGIRSVPSSPEREAARERSADKLRRSTRHGDM